jgi:hypothetical protein
MGVTVGEETAALSPTRRQALYQLPYRLVRTWCKIHFGPILLK